MGWISLNCGCCSAAYDLEKFNNTGSPPSSQWRLLVISGTFPINYGHPPDGNGDLFLPRNNTQIDSTGVVNYSSTTVAQTGSKFIAGTDQTNSDYYGEIAGTTQGVIKITGSTGSTTWTKSVSGNWVGLNPQGVQAVNGGGAYCVGICPSGTPAGSATWMGHVDTTGSTLTEWQHVDSSGKAVGTGTAIVDSGGDVLIVAPGQNYSSPERDADNNWMYKFNSSGTHQWSYPASTTVDCPPTTSSGRLVAIQGTTFYHVSNVSGTYYLYSVNSSGTGTQLWTNSLLDEYATKSSGHDYPNSMAVDGSGNVYFGCDRSNGAEEGSIKKFNSSGVLQWTICYGWSRVMLDASGYIFGNGSDKDGTIATYSTFTDSSANLSNVSLSGVTVENSETGLLSAIYWHDTNVTWVYVYSNKTARDQAFNGGSPLGTLDLLCKFESTNATFTGTATLSEVNSSGVSGSIDIDTNTGAAMSDEKFLITGT